MQLKAICEPKEYLFPIVRSRSSQTAFILYTKKENLTGSLFCLSEGSDYFISAMDTLRNSLPSFLSSRVALQVQPEERRVREKGNGLCKIRH